MQCGLVDGYIPSCVECQQNKAWTSKPPGPLHPLAVPEGCFQSVAMDFIGPLPEDKNFDCIVTFPDCSNANVQILPCWMDMDRNDLEHIFFDNWYCENGCPSEIVLDWDKLFILKFWHSIMRLSGIKHKMSTSYHLQTNGSSEWTNKTVIQCIWYHVDQQQKRWVCSLHKICFDIMNSINVLTGYTSFMLKSSHQLCLIPPLFVPPVPDKDATHVVDDSGAIQLDAIAPVMISFMEELHESLADVQDSLFAAKLSQAYQANTSQAIDPSFNVGDKVLLSTEHRWKDYMQSKDGQVAKFMPCFDGPYSITKAFPSLSMYMLGISASFRIHPSFHVSLLQPFIANDPSLFPERELPCPGPIVTSRGQEEFFIDKIIDEWWRGLEKQYLVYWLGYRPESDSWLPGIELWDTEALNIWENITSEVMPTDTAGWRLSWMVGNFLKAGWV